MLKEILVAARRQLDESDAWMAFALACRDEYGWSCSEESALSRVSHWLHPDARWHLPASALPILIRVTGLDYVTPVLQMELLRVQGFERKPPRRIDPRSERGRRAAEG